MTSPYAAWLVFANELTPDPNDTVRVDVELSPTAQGGGMVENWQCTVQCLPGGFEIGGVNGPGLSVTLDPDPFINFGTSATDFGAPSSFAFVFQQSIVPTGTPGVATSSLSGSTTNGGGLPGTVTVTPLAPPAGISQDGPDQAPLPDEIMVYSLSTSGLAGPWLNVGIDLGPAFTSNPSLVSDNFGAYNAGPVAGPAGSGSYDAMRVDVNFMLSGGGDVFTFNGDATIVPEPATAALLGLGLAGLGALRRRRQP